jgi:monovalent cation/hydrogen antiporter
VHIVEATLALVVLAIAVASVAERLRTPAPSLLVLVGLGVGYLPGIPQTHVSPLLVTLGVLPPLLFSSAQQISLVELRAVWRPVAVLAVGLVAVTAAAVAGLTHWLFPSIGLAVAFTLGAILASTDPVAVTALSRQLRLPERLQTLVQSESLFNDATSLVLFQVAVTAVTAGGMSIAEGGWRFARLGGGGALLGVAVGLLASLLVRRAAEPTVQAAIAVVTPYAAAVAAEAAGVSSVTAVIVTGLMLARRRARSRQPSGRLVASGVYDTIVFLLENAIFAVIGIELATFMRELPSSDQSRAGWLVLVVIVTLLAVRALALATAVTLPRLRRRGRGRPGAAGGPGAPDEPGRRTWPAAAVVTWAGARGVIPLAAALSIPLSTDTGAPFPHRALLLVVATAAVVVSLVVQGTTLRPLVERLGVTGDVGRSSRQLADARYAVAAAALSHLDQVADSIEASEPAVRRLRGELEQRVDVARADVSDHGGTRSSGRTSYDELRRRLIDVELDELARLRSAGEIGSDVFHELQRQLDLEAARLRR